MKSALTNLFLAFIAFSALMVMPVIVFFVTLPDVTTIKGCLTTELYKVRLCEKEPGFVTTKQVSKNLINALIMSEDASFYSHSGVDLSEIKESFITNISRGKFARGGSTITQQLAKNVFFSNEKSFIRKLRELFTAFNLEKHYTKDQILSYYLNIVEFGPDIYGISKATKYYFNKDPADLSPEESAFIVFLLPNPKAYHQSFQKRELTPFASKMVRRILHKMYAAHRLSEEDYLLAKSKIPDFFGPGTGSSEKSDEEIDQEFSESTFADPNEPEFKMDENQE